MPVSLKKKEDPSTEVIEEKESKTENCTSEHPYSDALLILNAMLCVVLLVSIVVITFFKFITSCPDLFGEVSNWLSNQTDCPDLFGEVSNWLSNQTDSIVL